jgi:hypothetical protein
MAITPVEITLAVIVVLLAIGLAVVWMRQRRTDQLKSKYGPEYSRVVKEEGSPRKAEEALRDREKRVSTFQIAPVSPERRREFVDAWRKVQAQFVDDPQGAVTHADVLLGQVMEERGYPVTDFDQRSADLSVDHPDVVQNYRAAHDIALRHARGEAGTEDLRQAMIHYRALFDDLVNEPSGDHDPRVTKLGEKVRD